MARTGIKAGMAEVGIVSGAVAACAACCLPLIVPAAASFLGSAGVYGIGDAVKPWHIAAAAVFIFGAAFSWMRMRRKARAADANANANAGACKCEGSCKT